MRTISVDERDQIDEIIKSCKTCYLGMSLDGLPYVVPMNFALDGDTVILHSGVGVRKWKMLNKNPKVCINWTLGEEIVWQDKNVGCSYRVVSQSVIVEGSVSFVDDYEEKYNCLQKIMAQYSDLSFEFNKPAVKNVGVFKVHIEKISARRFGVRHGEISKK